MTVSIRFDPADYSPGTALAGLPSCVVFPALADDGTPGPAPNWRTTGDGIDYEPVGGYRQPRVMFDYGAAIIRGQTKLRDGNRVAILCQPGGLDFLVLGRQTGGSGPALGFYSYQNGYPTDPAFPYGWIYNEFGPQNGYTDGLPDVCNIDWVVSGNVLRVSINGTDQYMRSPPISGAPTLDIILPDYLLGASLAGYFPEYHNLSFGFPLVLRDNLDLIQINKVEAVRYDVTTSKLRVTGFCNITGSTHVTVLVHTGPDQTGTLVATLTGTRSGNTFTVDSGSIPNSYAMTRFYLTAQNVEGVTDTATTQFDMPLTAYHWPSKFFQNASPEDYYTAYSYNDLARQTTWQGGAHIYICRPVEDYDLLRAVGVNCWPASYCNMQDNGSPTKFPDNGDTLSTPLPWTPERGAYLLDLRKIPLLDEHWFFQGDLSNITVTRDYRGQRYVHLVEIDADFVNAFALRLEPNLSAPNKGMPTEPWIYTFAKVGSSPDMVWSRSHLEWILQQAISGERHMTDQLGWEQWFGFPPGIITAAHRSRPEHQTWAYWGPVPSHCHEHLAQKHNACDLDLWDNLSRLTDHSYRFERLSYFRAHLKAGLRYLVTCGNERGNFGQPQYSGYERTGLAKGLGLVDADGNDAAVYGADNGTWPADYVLWAAGSWTNGDMVKFAGDVWLCTADVASAGEGDQASWPNNDTAHWRRLQRGNRASERAYAEDLISVHQMLVEIWGSQAAYQAGGVSIAVEAWLPDYYNDVSHILAWGPMIDICRTVAHAPYFGPRIFDARTSGEATDDFVAQMVTLSGDARVAAMSAEAVRAAQIAVDQDAQTARLLAQVEADFGLPQGSLEIVRYEGGQHFYWAMSNTVLAARGHDPIDQHQLALDYQRFRQDGIYAAYRAYYDGKAAQVGGIDCHFDSRNIVWLNPPYEIPDQHFYFGTSLTWLDRETSGMYRGIRDSALEWSDREVRSLPAPVRRRPAPVAITYRV